MFEVLSHIKGHRPLYTHVLFVCKFQSKESKVKICIFCIRCNNASGRVFLEVSIQFHSTLWMYY